MKLHLQALPARLSAGLEASALPLPRVAAQGDGAATALTGARRGIGEYFEVRA